MIYEDNGVGIPEDEKEKIFGECYGKGTGYGLYLIKSGETYGWTIQETGKKGKGAQFVMTIPKMNRNKKTITTSSNLSTDKNYYLIIVRSILNRVVAFSAWGLFAGIINISPAFN
ncbi:MAG: hypothetical protein CW691_03695 [Candidatus Bathyarchaeum sp.]|nr:MAG: hypothetical protein CW691_03695 [Candidatus Bathyarchaeum sp.]